MRHGYKVYDSDTHIGPSADTLEKYLSSRVRAFVPDLESHKVPHKRHSTGLEYAEPCPKRFRLGSRGVGGWGADAPRVLGEAEPGATVRGASGGTTPSRPSANPERCQHPGSLFAWARVPSVTQSGTDTLTPALSRRERGRNTVCAPDDPI